MVALAKPHLSTSLAAADDQKNSQGAFIYNEEFSENFGMSAYLFILALLCELLNETLSMSPVRPRPSIRCCL